MPISLCPPPPGLLRANACPLVGPQKICNVSIDGDRFKFQLWDLAGQERFRTIIASYYQGAHGFIIVYDVTDPRSFENVEYWLDKVEKYAPIKMLVGNKSDLTGSRAVTFEKGEKFARDRGMQFFETSAKVNYSVEEAFISLALQIKESGCATQAPSFASVKGLVENSQPGSPSESSEPEPEQAQEAEPPLPATWSAKDVHTWARGCNLPDGVAEQLLADEVDGETLLGLESKREVKESLGLPLGKAAKLWDKIVELRAPPDGGETERMLMLAPQVAGSEAYMHADSLLRSSWQKKDMYEFV
eukprot:COSAG02_NODE_4466_length_5332_cov_3.159564_6_plen_301_part_01